MRCTTEGVHNEGCATDGHENRLCYEAVNNGRPRLSWASSSRASLVEGSSAPCLNTCVHPAAQAPTPIQVKNIRTMRDERWREGSTIGITCSTCTSTAHTSTTHTPAETHTPTPRKQWRTERMRSRPERSVINPERDKERTGENHQRSQPESRRLKTFGPLGLLH